MTFNHNFSGRLALATCLALASSLVSTIAKSESNSYPETSGAKPTTSIKSSVVNEKIKMLTPKYGGYLAQDFHETQPFVQAPKFGETHPGFTEFNRKIKKTIRKLADRPSAIETLQQIQKLS